MTTYPPSTASKTQQLILVTKLTSLDKNATNILQAIQNKMQNFAMRLQLQLSLFSNVLVHVEVMPLTQQTLT